MDEDDFDDVDYREALDEFEAFYIVFGDWPQWQQSNLPKPQDDVEF